MEPSARKSILNIKDLDLGYPGAGLLLHKASANLFRGEMTALVGRNGAGKSTLLKAISGSLNAGQGSILLNDFPLSSYLPKELSVLLSFVGTGGNPVENMSVFEMVSLGRHPYTNWWGSIRTEDRKIILQSIDFVGMSSYLDVSVNRLSDGERQRVMIARALAQDTPLIILDEPTAFLDIPNKIAISEVLDKMKKEGKSILFSTHDFDTVFQFADKVWVLHDNNLIEGAPEDLGLSNTFNEIFNDANVEFDENESRFKKQTPLSGKVRLLSDDESLYLWTARILKRLNFSIIDTENEEFLTIIAMNSMENAIWKVKDSCNENSFHSLYELAGFLTLAR